MREEIIGQLRFLLLSLCLGMGYIAGYDVLRLIRFFLPHGKLALWVEDLFYWSAVSVPGYCVFFWFNKGLIRWYGILAVFIGALIYEMGISRVLRRQGNRFFLPKKRKLHRAWLNLKRRSALFKKMLFQKSNAK